MSSDRPSPGSHRILYIDRLRGAAVLGMFVGHSAYAFLTRLIPYNGYFRANMEMAGMVAPVFCFLAGISVALLSSKAWQKALNSGDQAEARKKQLSLKRRIITRGAQILALGYALRLTFWMLSHFYGSWTRILKVDILQCIGLSLIVFPLLAWPPNPQKKGFRKVNWIAGALCLAWMLSTPFFFHLPWKASVPLGIRAYFDVGSPLALFPFFPYGTWIALGLFVGSFVTTPILKGKKEFWVLGGLGVAALAFYATGSWLDTLTKTYPLYQLWGETRPPKGLFHGFLIKVAWLLVIYAIARISARGLDRLPLQPLSLLGQTSLFAYCTHLVILYHVFYHRVSFPTGPTTHLLLSGLLTAVMFALCWLWWKKASLVPLTKAAVGRLLPGERGVH